MLKQSGYIPYCCPGWFSHSEQPGLQPAAARLQENPRNRVRTDRPFPLFFPGANLQKAQWLVRNEGRYRVQDRSSPNKMYFELLHLFSPLLKFYCNGIHTDICKTITALTLNCINTNSLRVTKSRLWSGIKEHHTYYGCDITFTFVFILKTVFSLKSQWKDSSAQELLQK